MHQTILPSFSHLCKNFLQIVSVQPGGPADLAGIKPGDLICGAFGSSFSQSGEAHSILGPRREFGLAIERAEANGGALPLMVLKSAVGLTTVNVTLAAAGAFRPGYVRAGSPKYDALYETSCLNIHNRIMANGIDVFQHSWAGLALLGHPNWNDTTGAKPYRLSINKIKDAVVAHINSRAYAPEEGNLPDGTANPNAVDEGLGNWGNGSAAMFIAEYYAKTNDAAVLPAVQRAAELLANRIQWWKQPRSSPGATFQPEEAGMVGHGCVSGDYIHLGYGRGINIVGVHIAGGLSLCKAAGADSSVRPGDGHGVNAVHQWNDVTKSLDLNTVWNGTNYSVYSILNPTGTGQNVTPRQSFEYTFAIDHHYSRNATCR